MNYDYIIIGGGMAGGQAAKGIREHDKNGSIAIFSKENYLPYYRPALTKDLWTGKEKYEEIFILPQDYLDKNNIEFFLNYNITNIDPSAKTITDSTGNKYKYKKLLIATGGEPQTMRIEGGENVSYYRHVEDYKRLREIVEKANRFLVIGGGFIGAEISASLTMNNKKVTMVFPESTLLSRVLPQDLSVFVTDYYRQKGVDIVNNDSVSSLGISSGDITGKTRTGRLVVSDYVIAGIGIKLNIELAEKAGLEINNGIVVDNYLGTSNPDIYAAGDLANFPASALDRRMRVEHWNNSEEQGKLAGENMAGANKSYDILPYFYSDMFDLGFEAVGTLDSSMTTYSEWREAYREGIIYYFKDNMVKGVLLWNVWEKVDAARELIGRKEKHENVESIRGKISW